MTTSEISARAGVRLNARSFAIDGDFDLLDAFDPDGFAWIDQGHGFVASGVAAVVAPDDARSLLSSISHWSDDGEVSPEAGPRAVGALPFAGAGAFVVPARIIGRDREGRTWQTVIDGAEVPPTVSAGSSRLAPTAFRVVSTTRREQWRVMVERALADIDRGSLEKVVLARAVEIDADHPFDLHAVMAYLRQSQPDCVVYADRGFVGASPELLVRKTGTDVTARPLAGTGVDTEALLRSPKDAREHALVVDAVVEALGRSCTDVRADGPSPLELADVSHLATTVTARAGRDDASIMDLVAALHPTPAVAGTPRAVSLAAIDALETGARGRYAGPCGWIDRRGDGEFVVALRGGEIDGAHAVIHAGAGIVAGSEPDAEWAETQQKLTPMLQALVRP